MTVPPFENRQSRARILILEHASLLREMHQLLLRSVGYDTIACDEPEAAFQDAEVHRCDIVLVDATRREFISATTIAGLRGARPNLPILGILWHPGPLPAVDLLARGISSVVEGPVNPRSLIEAVDRLLGYPAPPAAGNVGTTLLPAANRHVLASSPSSADVGTRRGLGLETPMAVARGDWKTETTARTGDGVSVTS